MKTEEARDCTVEYFQLHTKPKIPDIFDEFWSLNFSLDLKECRNSEKYPTVRRKIANDQIQIFLMLTVLELMRVFKMTLLLCFCKVSFTKKLIFTLLAPALQIQTSRM